VSPVSNWYLVAYDIRHPRRLRRVHRRLKQDALWVQKSVFFFEGHESALRTLLDDVAALMKAREDDLRAWPVDRIGAAWMYGTGADESAVVVPRKEAWWRRFWRRLAA